MCRMGDVIDYHALKMKSAWPTQNYSMAWEAGPRAAKGSSLIRIMVSLNTYNYMAKTLMLRNTWSDAGSCKGPLRNHYWWSGRGRGDFTGRGGGAPLRFDRNLEGKVHLCQIFKENSMCSIYLTVTKETL